MRPLLAWIVLAVWPCLGAGDPVRLRVVLFDIAPYAAAPGGLPEGLYVDWVHRFLGRQARPYDIDLMPFGRIPLALEQKEADLTISFPTEALEQAAVALGPVLQVDSLVVTRLSKPALRVDDLHGAQIGRARGGCQDLAQRSDLKLRWVEVNGFDKGLRMLELGRLDGLCLTRDVLSNQLVRLRMERSSLGPEIVVSRRMALLFARRTLDPAVQASLKGAMTGQELMRRD